jgi:serine protease Do
MKLMRLAFLIVLAAFFLVNVNCSSSSGEKLTEEQMTAYRTRPAVVLIYSGMYVKIALKSGQQFEVPNYGSGSGFFINPDGYLVTNGHVVDIYKKYMDDKNGYAQQVLNNTIIQKIIQEFKQSNGREPSQEEIQKEYMKFMKDQQPQVVDHGAINYVLLSNSETLRFELKKFSPSIPDGGKDIAVLKIERDNCPVIMLGDSSKLNLQQPVFTIGFPAVVDPKRFPLLEQKNTLKSSITRGSISALKTDYKGMSVIQHDSATSPGNSGGPTVDIHGNVIGVHSYAATEYDGFKFCVPINAAKEFIRDAGVEFNKTSEFTTVFNKLMDSVWEGRWFDAQTEVSTALAYMKNEPDLEKLQQLTLRRISEMGFFEKIWRQNKMVVIIAVVLLILILVVLKISFTPSSAEEPAPIPAQEPEAAAPPEDKTKLAEDEATVMEGEIAGTLTVLVKGEELGTFNITSAPTIIGRDPQTASVLIKNEIVSKNHLKVIPKADQFFLVDLGSTNGTYVNGEKISETLVTPDDMVQLGKRGDIKLVFKK